MMWHKWYGRIQWSDLGSSTRINVVYYSGYAERWLKSLVFKWKEKLNIKLVFSWIMAWMFDTYSGLVDAVSTDKQTSQMICPVLEWSRFLGVWYSDPHYTTIENVLHPTYCQQYERERLRVHHCKHSIVSKSIFHIKVFSQWNKHFSYFTFFRLARSYRPTQQRKAKLCRYKFLTWIPDKNGMEVIHFTKI